MKFTFEEIDQLAALLEAEADGRAFDLHEAGLLALRLAELCPEIGASMRLVAQRMIPDACQDVA